MLVVPDDSSYVTSGLTFFAALFVGAAGCVAFTVILAMRMGSAKRRRAAIAAASGGLYRKY